MWFENEIHQYVTKVDTIEMPSVLWVYFWRYDNNYLEDGQPIEEFNASNSKELKQQITMRNDKKNPPEEQSEIWIIFLKNSCLIT